MLNDLYTSVGIPKEGYATIFKNLLHSEEKKNNNTTQKICYVAGQLHLNQLR